MSLRVIVAVLVCLLAGSSLSGKAAGSAQSDSGAAAPEPFLPGEKLIFSVQWNPPWYLFFLPSMDAGEAELSLGGGTWFNDKKALTILFHARSSGSLVRGAGLTIDDRFEFLTDPETLCTFKVEKKELEGKRKREIDVVYFPERRQLHIRELDLALQPPKVLRDEFVNDIPACVKDLFSALYSMRRKEIGAGTQHRFVVGDNARVKEVEVRVEKKEIVPTPEGKVEAWKLGTIAVLGGLFKDGGQFSFWLTADQRKLPVRFEVKVKLGKVTGRLKSMQNVGAVRKPNSVSLR